MASLSDFEREDDPRYTLTAEEKEEVIALKKRCDEDGVMYRSVFELAKFCFVASCLPTPEKRLEESFSRIKKKRAFEAKHNLDELDLLTCVKELQENLPDWAISCGKVNNKWCVGYTSHSANLTYMKAAFKTICKVELARFDLAASDLEEARNGFYIVGSGHGLRPNPLKAIRVASSLRCLFDKMNANRVKGIYYEVPRPIALVSSLFLSVLPSKLKERIRLSKNLNDMDFYKKYEKELVQSLPVRT